MVQLHRDDTSSGVWVKGWDGMKFDKFWLVDVMKVRLE